VKVKMRRRVALCGSLSGWLAIRIGPAAL